MDWMAQLLSHPNLLPSILSEALNFDVFINQLEIARSISHQSSNMNYPMMSIKFKEEFLFFKSLLCILSYYNNKNSNLIFVKEKSKRDFTSLNNNAD